MGDTGHRRSKGVDDAEGIREAMEDGRLKRPEPPEKRMSGIVREALRLIDDEATAAAIRDAFEHGVSVADLRALVSWQLIVLQEQIADSTLVANDGHRHLRETTRLLMDLTKMEGPVGDRVPGTLNINVTVNGSPATDERTDDDGDQLEVSG